MSDCLGPRTNGWGKVEAPMTGTPASSTTITWRFSNPVDIEHEMNNKAQTTSQNDRMPLDLFIASVEVCAVHCTNNISRHGLDRDVVVVLLILFVSWLAVRCVGEISV